MRMLKIVFLVAALALIPQLAAAHGGSEIGVTGHPHPDGPIDISGMGFLPGEVVTIELRKAGMPSVRLGPVPAGADGSFAVTFHVPASVQPGLYQLAAVSADDTTIAEATILAPPSASGASTSTATAATVTSNRPVAETISLWVVTAAVAALGAAIVLAERRQPPKHLQGS